MTTIVGSTVEYKLITLPAITTAWKEEIYTTFQYCENTGAKKDVKHYINGVLVEKIEFKRKLRK